MSACESLLGCTLAVQQVRGCVQQVKNKVNLQAVCSEVFQRIQAHTLSCITVRGLPPSLGALAVPTLVDRPIGRCGEGHHPTPRLPCLFHRLH